MHSNTIRGKGYQTNLPRLSKWPIEIYQALQEPDIDQLKIEIGGLVKFCRRKGLTTTFIRKDELIIFKISAALVQNLDLFIQSGGRDPERGLFRVEPYASVIQMQSTYICRGTYPRYENQCWTSENSGKSTFSAFSMATTEKILDFK